MYIPHVAVCATLMLLLPYMPAAMPAAAQDGGVTHSTTHWSYSSVKTTTKCTTSTKVKTTTRCTTSTTTKTSAKTTAKTTTKASSTKMMTTTTTKPSTTASPTTTSSAASSSSSSVTTTATTTTAAAATASCSAAAAPSGCVYDVYCDSDYNGNRFDINFATTVDECAVAAYNEAAGAFSFDPASNICYVSGQGMPGDPSNLVAMPGSGEFAGVAPPGSSCYSHPIIIIDPPDDGGGE